MTLTGARVGPVGGCVQHGDPFAPELGKDELLNAVGPGKGNAALGVKGAYCRTPGLTPMADAMRHRDPSFFNAECGVIINEFNDLHTLSQFDLSLEMDPRLLKNIRMRNGGR